MKVYHPRLPVSPAVASVVDHCLLPFLLACLFSGKAANPGQTGARNGAPVSTLYGVRFPELYGRICARMRWNVQQLASDIQRDQRGAETVCHYCQGLVAWRKIIAANPIVHRQTSCELGLRATLGGLIASSQHEIIVHFRLLN